METLKQALGRLSPTDPQRIPLAQQLTNLETTVSEPSRLSLRAKSAPASSASAATGRCCNWPSSGFAPKRQN